MQKDIIYIGDSLRVISGFPDKAKQRLLALLDSISNSIMPHPKEFKSISAVGRGTYELRVKIRKQYRVFYVAKFKSGIYVLHAFVKKTQKTAIKDMKIGVSRYQSLIALENENEQKG